jgi:hypothetical protein
MYHALEESRLYNFTEGVQTDVSLKYNDESVGTLGFLDEVSMWMEKHPKIVRDKYLPFSCVAVGLPPDRVSAFLYGCFVGRAMEKKGVTVNIQQSIIDKKVLASKVKDSINQQIKWFQKLRRQIDTVEEKDDMNDEK